MVRIQSIIKSVFLELELPKVFYGSFQANSRQSTRYFEVTEEGLGVWLANWLLSVVVGRKSILINFSCRSPPSFPIECLGVIDFPAISDANRRQSIAECPKEGLIGGGIRIGSGCGRSSVIALRHKQIKDNYFN